MRFVNTVAFMSTWLPDKQTRICCLESHTIPALRQFRLIIFCCQLSSAVFNDHSDSFYEFLMPVPKRQKISYTQILILAVATLRFVLKVFSVLRRWRARYSVPSGCLGCTVVQNLTPDVAITMKHRLRIGNLKRIHSVSRQNNFFGAP